MTATLTLYRRSELESVKQGCLFRTRALWEQGVEDSSDIAWVGIAFHRIKYHYITALVEHGLTADAELAQAAFVEGVAQSQAPNWLIPEIRQLWERHAESWELPLEQYVTHEERQVSGNVSFTPDLVTANAAINQLEIRDDKSGWSPPLSEDEVRMLFQARVYTLFARERWPNFTSYKFTINAVRFNKSTSVVFTDAELDEVEREVRAHIATIEHARETNSWPAVAGPSCRFCSLQCPLMEQSLTVPKRILDMAQAEKLAGFLLAAEAVTKAAKKTLKAYVSANGPVVVNSVVWNNRESMTTLYPVDVLLEVLKQRNILGAFEDARQQGLTISKSALAKLFKAYPLLQDDLQGYAIEKSTYRFSARQPGQEEDDE